MRGECAGIVRNVADGAAGSFKILLGAFAGHLHKPAQRQQADFVVGVADFEAEEPRPKAEGERLNPHPAQLGHQEMPKLVHHHHDADKDDKSCCRYEECVHRCTVSSLGFTRPSRRLLASLRRAEPVPVPALPSRRRAPAQWLLGGPPGSTRVLPQLYAGCR